MRIEDNTGFPGSTDWFLTPANPGKHLQLCRWRHDNVRASVWFILSSIFAVMTRTGLLHDPDGLGHSYLYST